MPKVNSPMRNVEVIWGHNTWGTDRMHQPQPFTDPKEAIAFMVAVVEALGPGAFAFLVEKRGNAKQNLTTITWNEVSGEIYCSGEYISQPRQQVSFDRVKEILATARGPLAIHPVEPRSL